MEGKHVVYFRILTYFQASPVATHVLVTPEKHRITTGITELNLRRCLMNMRLLAGKKKRDNKWKVGTRVPCLRKRRNFMLIKKLELPFPSLTLRTHSSRHFRRRKTIGGKQEANHVEKSRDYFRSFLSFIFLRVTQWVLTGRFLFIARWWLGWWRRWFHWIFTESRNFPRKFVRFALKYTQIRARKPRNSTTPFAKDKFIKLRVTRLKSFDFQLEVRRKNPHLCKKSRRRTLIVIWLYWPPSITQDARISPIPGKANGELCRSDAYFASASEWLGEGEKEIIWKQ